VVAIGISERTSAEAIESLAEALLNQSSFVQVMAIEIPKQRAFMHLDTVFTMVNHDQFTIYPGIENQDGEMNIFYLYRDKMGKISIQRRSRLLDALKEVLHLSDLDLIPCGGGDPVIAAREQWNDGSNTLAIAPGVVVTYDRNVVTNETLRQHGITVIETPSSELARGRGGPRCMSMPLVREVI
jgi:arginine deiminase